MPFKLIRPRSTAWLDITALALAAGAVSGRLYLEREGRDVILEFQDFVPSAVAAASVTLTGVLPSGFWPPRFVELPLAPRIQGSTSEIGGAVRVRTEGTLDFYRPEAGAKARGQVRFRTHQAMPAPSDWPGVKL